MKFAESDFHLVDKVKYGGAGSGELAGYLTVIRRRNGGNPLHSPHYSARGEKKRLFPTLLASSHMEAGRREAPVKDAAGGVRFPPLSPIVFRSNCSVERGSTWFVGTLNSLSSLGTVESNEVRYFYAAARSTGCSRVFPGISADAVCIGVRVAISTEG